MPRYAHISVAIPLLAELDNLPLMLERLRRQTYRQFTLYCCVNNLEGGYGYVDGQEEGCGMGTKAAL